ncbi:hypothetical protein BGY98DRAFT_37119 [Russula aff. rugulosa BPL654]|nr:hypothetical protein BGY98DRAFT_37119 [Russula aff. rugulosa BPL654]
MWAPLSVLASKMTNFSDPSVQLKDFAALQSFWHITHGIYIWEYVTTLDFELDIIRGRRSYRWTIWIYSLARATLLIAVIISLVGLNVTVPMNCQALITLQVATGYAGLVCASLLVIFRICAIWNKNKSAVAIAVIAWVTNVLVTIYGVARLRAMWIPAFQTCAVRNSEEIKPALITTLITDIILLVTMLVGLFRLFIDNNCAFGVGRLLWKQAIIWLLISTVAGAPPTVFIFLNLNGPLNVMFQLPLSITNTIAATRIYRSLADYTFESSNFSLDAGSSKCDNKVSKWNDPAPISLNQIEVVVDTAYEQYPTSRTTLGVGTQQGGKPHELSVDSDSA